MGSRRLCSLISLRPSLPLHRETVKLHCFSSHNILSKSNNGNPFLQARAFSTTTTTHKDDPPVSIVDSILAHNKGFVERKEYQPYQTDRYPHKRVVVLTCMDTRLSELLPKAMDLRQGDAKILKTAGAVVNHPFGSIMRSIIVAVYNLEAKDIIVVGHDDCGMAHLDSGKILEKARERGIKPETIKLLSHSGVDINSWLHSFESVEEAVCSSVEKIKNHPLLPKDINVHGMVMNPVTGKLTQLV